MAAKVLRATAHRVHLTGSDRAVIVVVVQDGDQELVVEVGSLPQHLADAIDHSPDGVAVILPGLRRRAGDPPVPWHAVTIDRA
jgi:hypothetical protein